MRSFASHSNLFSNFISDLDQKSSESGCLKTQTKLFISVKVWAEKKKDESAFRSHERAKMKITIRLLLGFIVVLALSVSVGAQTSGETEVGTDDRGGSFASQYIFYDWPQMNLLARYFWVNGAVNRAEFAFGPTLKFGETVVKLQPGFNTSGSLKIAALLTGKLSGHGLLYIIDKNWSVTHSESGWLYQKLFIGIDEESVWQFRVESLHIGYDLVFLRIGGEYQVQFDPKHHLYIAPFYDPVVKTPGAQIGFRFF